MKGLYILIIVVLIAAVLAYLAGKSTDSDLRRSFSKLGTALEKLESDLAALNEPISFLQGQKRRTFILDKERDSLRNKASQLRIKLNAAQHNLENLSPEIRDTTEAFFAELDKEMQQELSVVAFFSRKVNVLHGFVKEGYPLRSKVETLQTRMNGLVESRNKSGKPLSKDQLSDVESYNYQCEQIQNHMTLAMTTIHKDIEHGDIMAQTAINELRKLIPNLEAFLEDLGK
ncbi:MAG: hypothetical protein ABIK28_15275 [Planctomycetota bacterium]